MSKRRDFTYAYICLEKWVIWNTEHSGYPSRSCVIRLDSGSSGPVGSSIPEGVESFDRDVERANTALAMMRASSSKSARRASILKAVTAARSGGESVMDAINRLEMKISESAYYHALEEFDIRLEMLVYSRA